MSKVLLYSGGLDSACLLRTNHFDTVLFARTGTPDNVMEFDRLPKGDMFTVVDCRFLAEYELENKILPFRNSFFALIAAQYGNEIYMGATIGDTTKDKDYVFASQVEGMLNYFCLDTHKAPHAEYPFKVVMPYKNKTKTEIVRQTMKQVPQAMKHILAISRSCYEGNLPIECGECRSCVRKAVALINNGLMSKVKFIHSPDDLQKLDALYKESVEKGRHKKELDEIVEAIERVQGVHGK